MKMCLLSLVITAVALVCNSRDLLAEAVQITGPTMGTHYKVVIDGPPKEFDGEALQVKIEVRLGEINQQMSTWDDASEISKFNQSTSIDWFKASPEFAAVVQEAKLIFEASDGAFDPTVEPLIKLWGFGDQREQEVPAEADVLAALRQTGMSSIQVRLDPPALKKDIAELQLNLSAIAKGYAVDAVAELLQGESLPAYVVDIGGENKAGIAKSSGEPWKLGVESPLGGLQRVVKVLGCSVATSGDYRNFFKMDGVTYSHAIDPDSGWPVKNPPASVSVIADSCMTADAWATAMMVLGVKEGSRIAKKNSLSVMFQEVDQDGKVIETALGAFTLGDVIIEGGAAEDLPEAAASMPWFPFVAAAAIFLIAVAGMAIGTIVQNKSIKGSCGGLASMPGSEGKSICELCTIPKDQCTNTELREQMQSATESQEEV